MRSFDLALLMHVLQASYAMIFQIKSVAASCIFGSLALLGVGC
jgi:hypothetical protein